MPPLKLESNVSVTLTEVGQPVRTWSSHNVVTSGGLSLVRDYLAVTDPSSAPVPPTYIALGSGQVLPGYYMTAQPGENFRGGIVQRDKTGLSVIYHGFFGPADNQDQTVADYGLWAGAAASSQVGTGILFALASGIPFNKNTTNALSIDWTITASGVV